MKQKAIKLILSGAASLALAVSLTATTFAYVLIGNNVIVEEFSFDVEGQEGLLISLDGENYSQDITSEQLKAKIAGSVEEFDKRNLVGTTVKHSSENAVYDIDNYLSFEKEQINYIKDSDTYEREYVGAVPNHDYIKFDLYFKALNTQTSATNFNLSFGERTFIKAYTDDVELYNGFNTWEYDEVGGYYTKKSYTSGQKVTQNVANAMRLAIYNEEDSKLSVYEVTDENDLGSAAINGKTDAKHDPYSSIMINYYNAIYPRYPFTGPDDNTKVDNNGNQIPGVIGADDGEAFHTINKYGVKNGQDWTGEKVGKFTTSDSLHLVVYIWLEGWDADYLLGTTLEGSKLSCGLEFNLTEA